MIESGQTNWVEVNLSAIRQNVRQIQVITGTAVMAVVKANAYGHGLSEASRAAVEAGAAWLGVARVDEALFLHRCGIPANLIVLGYTPPERAAEAAAAGVRLAVYDREVALAYAAQAQGCGHALMVHAKFDTGMGRLGADPRDGIEFVRLLKSLPALLLEGAFTHMAEADEPSKPTTQTQLNCFDELLEGLQALGLRPGLIHAANSAAALNFPRARYDLVRPGIAIYGLHPSPESPLPDGFRPALAWKTRLASVKTFPAGQGIGYNYRYHTTRNERIGVCAVGYADGFRRRFGNFALTGGKRVPVVGGVCMDQCMLQLDDVPEAQIGDEVVLIGRQGTAEITAEEVGREWGTFNYEVVCGLMARLPRIYKD